MPTVAQPSGVKAAIIREKGTNGEREMAYSLYLAGFDVKDVMMTDLITGRETLEDVNMIVFCGGFSNSDVLGSAKGWAGAFLFNPKAKEALDKFYARKDTLSLGICNGCQLMVELNLINPEHEHRTPMLHNNSHKFESTFLGSVDSAERQRDVLFTQRRQARHLGGSRRGHVSPCLSQRTSTMLWLNTTTQSILAILTVPTTTWPVSAQQTVATWQ